MRVVGSVIFACPGWIQNLKFSVWVWGSVIFSCPGQFWNLYCLVRSAVSHLSMSRPNLKFKILVRLGSVIFPCQGQIWNLKTFHESLGLVIFLCPGQIWNLKISVRVGGRASYHVQTQSEIQNFQWGLGGWVIFPCPDAIWNWRFLEGLIILPCPDPIWNLNCLVW